MSKLFLHLLVGLRVLVCAHTDLVNGRPMFAGKGSSARGDMAKRWKLLFGGAAAALGAAILIANSPLVV